MSARPATTPEALARAAAYWLTALMADDASAETRQRWRQWMDADPAHRDVWARFECLGVGLQTLHPDAARLGLSGLRSASRRRTLKCLAGAAAGGAGVAVMAQAYGWQNLLADHHTGRGESRQLTLADGTRVQLNSGSAVDIDYSSSLRRIRLRAGEILIETGTDPQARPMRVETAQGWVAPLGTRFVVSQQPAQTAVTVLSHRVLLMGQGWLRPYLLEAGQSADMAAQREVQVRAARDADSAWTRGELVADDVRLGDFVATLQRYRRGWLRCDPSVADLRLTALFPYLDTDKVLAAITQALPVAVQRRSPYWVTLVPAGTGRR